MSREAVIVEAVRTPVGKAHKGSFATTRPDDLGAWAVRGLVERTGVDPKLVDDALIGCAMTEGEQGYNVARQIAVGGGLPYETGAATINRFCSSSAYAIGLAVATIQAGWADCIVAGGAESMTMIPMTGLNPERTINPRLAEEHPGLYWPMGRTAEEVAKRFGIDRERQDDFGFNSHKRAVAAMEAGRFRDEILPVAVTGPDGKQHTIAKDDGPRPNVDRDKMRALAPAFADDGTVTAGNASQMSDGAAAGLVVSRAFASKHDLAPKARVLGAAVAGVEPEIMGIGPVPAVRKLLAQTKLSMADIDVVEINEAFAVQVLYSQDELDIPDKKLNPNGGAIALGHPLGATGARIAATLLHELPRRGGAGTKGIETMCVGGGQGFAIAYELV